MIASILLQAATGLASLSPWVAAGGAALQLGLGIGQLLKARKMRDIKRPMMTTPKALTELYSRRKFAAGTYGLPGQGQIEAKMARQQAASMRGIRESGQSAASQIAGIAAIDQTSKEATERLGVQGAQFNAQNQQLLDQVQRELAAQQRAEQEYNALGPFRDKQLAYAALYQGGMTNLAQFASNTAEIFAGLGKTG